VRESDNFLPLSDGRAKTVDIFSSARNDASMSTVRAVFTGAEPLAHYCEMAKKWYSPQLQAPVVRELYRLAKRSRIPMTKLTNDLLRAALRRGRSREITGRPRSS
jgi:hypothetical protein